MSWSDAEHYAWWIGGGIPSAASAEPISGMLSWTCDWQDESKALMRLAGDSAGQDPAANPDVRASRIGFRVTTPAS